MIAVATLKGWNFTQLPLFLIQITTFELHGWTQTFG